MSLIKLPRKRLISMDKESITIDMPEKETVKKKINYEAIKKAEGILSHKKEDLLKFEKEVREDRD